MQMMFHGGKTAIIALQGVRIDIERFYSLASPRHSTEIVPLRLWGFCCI